VKRKKGSVVAGTILAIGLILVGASFLMGPIDFHGFDFEDATNYQNEYTEIFSNPQINKIYVSTLNGYIQVESWENDYVQVEVKQRYAGYSEKKMEELFESTKPEITFLGSSMRIVTPRLSKTSFFKSYGVSISVKVPHNLINNVETKTSNGSLKFSDLNAQIIGSTSNGSIDLSNVDGDIDLRTSNGSISLLKVSGEAKLDSSNGKFYASGFMGSLHVETSNASIEIEDSQAQVYLRTSNGSIYVRDSSLLGASNTLKTSNGKIVLDSALPDSGQLKLTTSNGGIEFVMPYGTGAVITANTSNGKIILDNVPILTEEIGKTSISGSIYGGGDLHIELSSSNSDIKISGK